MTSVQFTHAQGLGYTRGMYRVATVNTDLSTWHPCMQVWKCPLNDPAESVKAVLIAYL